MNEESNVKVIFSDGGYIITSSSSAKHYESDKDYVKTEDYLLGSPSTSRKTESKALKTIRRMADDLAFAIGVAKNRKNSCNCTSEDKRLTKIYMRLMKLQDKLNNL